MDTLMLDDRELDRDPRDCFCNTKTRTAARLVCCMMTMGCGDSSAVKAPDL